MTKPFCRKHKKACFKRKMSDMDVLSSFDHIQYVCTEVRANYNSYQMQAHRVPPLNHNTPSHSHTHTHFEKWSSQSGAIILHTLVSVRWVGWKMSVKCV